MTPTRKLIFFMGTAVVVVALVLVLPKMGPAGERFDCSDARADAAAAGPAPLVPVTSLAVQVAAPTGPAPLSDEQMAKVAEIAATDPLRARAERLRWESEALAAWRLAEATEYPFIPPPTLPPEQQSAIRAAANLSDCEASPKYGEPTWMAVAARDSIQNTSLATVGVLSVLVVGWALTGRPRGSTSPPRLRVEVAAVDPSPTTEPPVKPLDQPTSTASDRLRSLQTLRDDGLMSEDEFQTKRKQIIEAV